jgi:sarcosine oxidase subunit gamma
MVSLKPQDPHVILPEGAQTILELSGNNVINLIKKPTSCVLHLDKVQLVVRRSFADYVWLWIQQGSHEYSLIIV